MSTKLELISSALAELGLAQYVFDASAEKLEEALNRFNRMAAQWDGMGIRVGYNFGSDINAESGVPDTAEDCFVLNGALRIAPTFGKTPSPDTRVAASKAFNALYVARRQMPEVPYPSNLPVGVGNQRGVMGQQYFPETDEVTGLNDGATEY